jgi:prophage regulatory protein
MEKILRLPEVKAVTGKSRSSIYQGMADGSFPQPVALGARAIGWRESDLEAWLQLLQTKRAALDCNTTTRRKGRERAEVSE